MAENFQKQKTSYHKEFLLNLRWINKKSAAFRKK